MSQTDDFPETFYSIIEIPMGSSIKYEYKEGIGMVADRFLYTSMVYPFNYGFIPGTKGEDGDPLDVLVISSLPVNTGVAIKCKAIGLGLMEDEEGVDYKIIAVPVEKVDPYIQYKEIQDVPQLIKDKIKHFFEHYKELEKGKWVKFTGFDSKAKALEIIKTHKV
ncbi:MAG: inorganic diphosphatase [Candidatus Rehaiarchaeum fermentans]|nr:inorganic diphosphatase [Candidatus Rehaiarchaeum fermentans]MCW1292522.1 inorganic diphosphatase [Candidatus Rehaiarchaeum fermentans]MCW1293208.1 inorganic diphosphatase [Candidatus Rehaiarchaeum fermentans]MCW1297420.1 inorganic diphosphatase [Candidatus Rehaiarchaeum fermentans]MCW1302477.1 inorganic diphosphatase [Candidatus Rehaiarchaeum fermentans]